MLGRLVHVVLHSIPILPLITSSTCLVSFCLVSVLFSAIHTLHTYTHTLMFPCCIHGWEKQSTHASSSSFFFVPCFALFLVPIAWAKFWERFDWLILFLDSFSFLFFFCFFFVVFLEVWIERKTYSTVSRDPMHITLVDRIFPIIF